MTAAAGVDWLVLDLEHGSGGEEQVRDEQIAAVDGGDVLFVGPQDLSHNLGVPFDLQAPAYLTALERVRGAAERHGKACGLLVGDGAAAAARHAEGWTFVAIGSDATLLAAAVAAELGRARQPTSGTRGGRR